MKGSVLATSVSIFLLIIASAFFSTVKFGIDNTERISSEECGSVAAKAAMLADIFERNVCGNSACSLSAELNGNADISISGAQARAACGRANASAQFLQKRNFSAKTESAPDRIKITMERVS